MKRFLLAVLSLVLAISFTNAQDSQDCLEGRYKEKIFQSYRKINNVKYGVAETSYGVMQKLVYDVYLPPLRDENNNRPVVMLAHGGGYINLLDQKSPDIVKIAEELVVRGYVVISVEYREEQSILSLFSEKDMVLAVARSLIDIRNATCQIADTTFNHGNPYGIDPERVFVGGVSAGSVSFLHAIFLDSLSWMPSQYQEWILEMEPNTQALLDDKYCGANIIGLINISGALLDTAWIKDYKKDIYPPMMHVHGDLDNIVPYKNRSPFDIKELPKLYGSYFINKGLQRLGIRSELDVWKGYGHVPFFGVNLGEILSGDLVNVILDKKIWPATRDHIIDFCYDLLKCEDIILSREDKPIQSLKAYPNPSNGKFYLDVPFEQINDKARVSIINTNGQEVFYRDFDFVSNIIEINHPLNSGLYLINLVLENNDKITSYSGKMMIVE